MLRELFDYIVITKWVFIVLIRTLVQKRVLYSLHDVPLTVLRLMRVVYLRGGMDMDEDDAIILKAIEFELNLRKKL